MPKEMHEASAAARKSYAPPSLTVYGGLAKLTASGTQGQQENNGTQTSKKP
jgi:hypothetical protein